jgi:hypothetical protein
MSGRGSRAALLAGLLMAVMACQAPAIRPQSTHPTPTPSPSGAERLEAADARLFAGDYDGAEARYLALIKDDVPGGAAHYSTLLAYEGRLQDAVAQAKAAVRSRTDSDSLARLARALDWSEDVAGAVAAGARAVQARPVTPLAHIFYSEALADSGQFSEAERELRAAERVVGDGYLRAELDREWANLYRNRGEQQSELNYIQLALKHQPAFPERQLELVRYDYSNQRPAAAQAILDKLRAGPNGRSYWVLVSGAGAAFIGGDTARADSLFTSAAQVRPGGAEAVLGQAELAVTVKRDFNAAHDLLAQVLKKDPGATQVYRYLRYLDLLVLKKDPDADLRALVPNPPADVMPELRKVALDTVNGYRSAVGAPPVSEDPALSQGAEAHAYYYLFNLGQPQLQGLGIHSEDESLPGFTGANSLLRDRHFGYSGTRGAEVIDHVATPEGSVRVWIDSVYHRYPLLARETAAAGFAVVSLGIVSISILDLGVGDPGQSDPVVYPTPGQVDVPVQFNGREVPDPVPAGGAYPVGYPVTLQVGAARTLAVTSGHLIGPDGREVAGYALGPAGSGLTPWEWALLPRQPLKAGGRYTVEVVGKVDGQDFTKSWSFTVASQ